jgi:Ricin-type beta-trefoil lectin domain-like
MSGDLNINERLIIVDKPGLEAAAFVGEEAPIAAGDVPAAATPEGLAAAVTPQGVPGRVLHVYGERVRIVEAEGGGETKPLYRTPTREFGAMADGALTQVEALGVAAFRLRSSPEYANAKQNRLGQGKEWNLPPGGCTGAPQPAEAEALELGAAAAPTSGYVEGPIAVGVVIVGGPTPDLQFSAAERTKVVAEVQNGLTYYSTTFAAAGLTFVYDIRHVQLTVPANPSAPDLEGLWRDPAMGSLGFPSSWAGVGQYVENLRTQLRTRWAYVVYFTKYPVFHFAYASVPRIVMQYSNDGWGPDNIDRVFAHETGHIFGCPDEYAASGCNCGGSFGRWGKPNTNCANCAPAGGIMCLMKGNDWAICPVTPAHLGVMPARLIAKHSSKAMDVFGGSTANGATLIQWPYHGGQNQMFRPDPVGGGYFRLVALNSGKVADVAGGSTANGAPIIQWDWHGGNNQLFRIETLSDGFARIIAKHSGKVVDVTGGSTANGARLIQWDWHGGNNQRWLMTAPIVARHSGKVLDISGGSTAAGAQLIQWDYHSGGNQIFRPELMGAGYYRFVAQHSGLVLDVAGASTANGAQLIQWQWHGGDNQLFRIEPLGDGHFRIVAKHSNKVLDVFGGSTVSGARIIQWPWHGGDNQRWLVPRW